MPRSELKLLDCGCLSEKNELKCYYCYRTICDLHSIKGNIKNSCHNLICLQKIQIELLIENNNQLEKLNNAIYHDDLYSVIKQFAKNL